KPALILMFSRTSEENSPWLFLSMKDEDGNATYEPPETQVAALQCLDPTRGKMRCNATALWAPTGDGSWKAWRICQLRLQLTAARYARFPSGWPACRGWRAAKLETD